MGRKFTLPQRKRGWRYEGWRACEDLTSQEINGVPRWFRCQRCNGLVTHGMIQAGGCASCGGRRIMPAMELSWKEILLLKCGLLPLNVRERAEVGPLWAWRRA